MGAKVVLFIESTTLFDGKLFFDVDFVTMVSVSFVFTVESNVFSDFGEHLRGDGEERGDGIERQVLHDAGATLSSDS